MTRTELIKAIENKGFRVIKVRNKPDCLGYIGVLIAGGRNELDKAAKLFNSTMVDVDGTDYKVSIAVRA